MTIKRLNKVVEKQEQKKEINYLQDIELNWGEKIKLMKSSSIFKDTDLFLLIAEHFKDNHLKKIFIGKC